MENYPFLCAWRSGAQPQVLKKSKMHEGVPMGNEGRGGGGVG